MIPSRVETGSPDLDDLLGGGFEPGIITQIYGEAGSGKSTFCIIAAVASLRQGRPVIYIDTEAFSAERFTQVAGEDAGALADNLSIYEAEDFDQQGLVIAECDRLLQSRQHGIIIVDSITGLYRSHTGTAGHSQRRLGQQLLRLLGFAKKYKIPVLVTNQVYVDIDRNETVGLGGTTMSHISKVIVRVEKKNAVRRAILEKHRSQPENRSFSFKIVEKGIIRVSDP